MTDFYLQIDSHLLAFGVVLLVFLAGCAFVALVVVAFACTVLGGAAAFGVLSRGWRLLGGVLGSIRRPWRSKSRSKDAGLPLSMEEALHQVATGKTAAVQGRPEKAHRQRTA